MFPPSRRLRAPLLATTAAYLAGILLAGTVAALGSYRIATAVMAELKSAAPPPGEGRSKAPLQSEASSGRASTRPVPAQFFGGSSRYWQNPYSRYNDEEERPSRRYWSEDRWDDDDEPRPRASGTYRTVCVRLCDGYYFPISFAATRNRFAHDAKACERSCGSEARLFVYSNPGGDIENMVDLKGRPYTQLSTAFRYRSEYVAACKCKPDPWDQEARDRHRMYALVAAKRNGSKEAAAELETLMAKMKQTAPSKHQETAAAPEDASPSRRSAPGPERADDRQHRMGLGARQPREARERPSQDRERPSQDWRRQPDWAARAFGPPN